METKTKKPKLSLAKRMAISLVCGLAAGIAFMFLRESLISGGRAEVWATINNLLFQDITAEGAERAFGLFYIIGQLFIKALQLVIIPMVFTSIALAIGPHLGQDPVLVPAVLFSGAAAGGRRGLHHLFHGAVQYPH